METEDKGQIIANTIYNQKTREAASDITYGIFNYSEGDSVNANNYKVIVGRLSPGDNIHYYGGQDTALSTAQRQQNVQNQVDKIIKYMFFLFIIRLKNYNFIATIF